MKILVIADSPAPYKVTFYEEISKIHDVRILFRHHILKDRKKEWFAKPDKLNCVFLSDNPIKRMFQIVKLNIDGFDLFWNMNYLTFDAIVLAIKFKIKHKLNLMHADGGIYKNRGFFLNGLVSFAMNLNDYFASSGIKTDEYYMKYGVNKNNIYRYMFSSVLSKNIQFNIKQKDSKQGNQINLLSVGQMIPRKGFDILLKAIKNVDNVKLTLIGGKPTQQYLTIINNYNLSDKVEILDFMPFNELKDYYLNADIFVFPTREDIWGLVLNEAMAFGLPIISTYNCVAAIEFDSLFNNCLLVPVDDIEKLNKAIKLLINDDNLRNNMAENSRNNARLITIDKMVEDYNRIFESLEEKL